MNERHHTLEESSIKIVNHQFNVAGRLSDIVAEHFPGCDSEYFSMDKQHYRSIMLRAQEALNEIGAASLIATSIHANLCEYLGADDFMIQSNVYLRASRPQQPTLQESIGFHRESFYGPNMERAVNVWTPIRGVNEMNTLRYVPKSHLIPDSEIVTENQGYQYTERFSDGHKLGFNYDPKKIISGVDLKEHSPLLVPQGFSALFSANLIHGAAANQSECIRFSIDFRVIASHYVRDESKSFHFASGKPYFVDFEAHEYRG